MREIERIASSIVETAESILEPYMKDISDKEAEVDRYASLAKYERRLRSL